MRGADPRLSPVTPSGRTGRLLLRGAALVVLVVLVAFVVAPQYADAQRALRSAGMVSPFLLLLGLLLELGSLAAFGMLTRLSLDPATRPRYPTVLRIDLAGIAVTNAVPGGGATALAARFGLFRRASVPSGAIVGALTVEAVVSNLLLGAVFATGILLSLGSLPASPYYWLAGAFILAVFGTAAIALGLAVRHPAKVDGVVRSATRAFSAAHQDAAVAFIQNVVDAVAAFAADRTRFWPAVIWGSVNWLLDIAALGVFLAAFGFHPTVGHLLLAYGLAAILALVPITPGGLGVIEGVLVPTLVALGSPYPTAVLGVTAWRLVQFWMPIPLGALSALSLMLRSRKTETVVSTT